MSEKEHATHQRLLRLWAQGRATKAQMLRCMELDRKAERTANQEVRRG
jgi:hypothetical protein